MNISEYSVQKPVTVIVLFALLLVVAAVMVPQLAVDMFPDTTRPAMSISTTYTGAGPEDVESNITEPLESALAGITRLTEIRSTSSSESSRINLNFSYDADMDEVKGEVESVIARISGALPDEASTPAIFQFSMSAMPIMQLVLRGNYSLDQLVALAEEKVQSRLERIDGVASTDVSGGRRQIVDVSVSRNRLAAHGLSLNQISSVLGSRNILSGGGSLLQGSTEYQIMTENTLTSVEDLKNTILTRTGGGKTRMVRLGDVADINLHEDDSGSQVFINGEPGVYLSVQNESGSNSVQISRAVREALPEIEAELPRGVALGVLSDNTTMIQSTLGQVYHAALQGALLAMAILFLFLRNIKSTFIIGLSIPISILVTLMFMALFDLTLNLLTLTGLVLGLGMIVDGSIVILENIHAYRERGAKPETAAILGSQEMLRAIAASTATTLCVFIPVMIFQSDLEMMGQLFHDLVFTVVISLIVSLAVALIVVPALAGPVLRLETRVQKPLKNRFLRWADNRAAGFFTALEAGYRRALGYALGHRLLMVLLLAALMFFTFVQAGSMGMNLFVRGSSDDQVSISLTMPPGTAREETQAVLEDLQKKVEAKVQGYEDIILTVGSRGRGGFGGSSGGNAGSLRITLPEPDEQIDNPTAIKAKLAEDIASIPGAQVTFSAGRRMGSSSAVDVELRSDNSDLSLETAAAIRSLLIREMPQVEDPAVSMEDGGPQLNIDLDLDRAALLGISPSAVTREIKTAINGTTAGTLTLDGEKVSINLQLAESDRGSVEELEALLISTTGGTGIPLSSIASIRESRGPADISRENQQRIIHVTGDLAAGFEATTIQEAIRGLVGANLVIPGGVEINYGGEARDIQRFGGSFIIIIIAAIILVFGVMASQFESFVDPFIIFFSIPPLFIGVIGIYLLSGEPFSLFSGVGVVALVGIVVNNGIVLVDYTNTLRSRGLKVDAACLEAGASRLQPILMTTLTTILGMVPLAFFPGEGAEMIQPIGKTLVGGLTVSSLMTLFITPVMYSLMNRRHDRIRERGHGKSEALKILQEASL